MPKRKASTGRKEPPKKMKLVVSTSRIASFDEKKNIDVGNNANIIFNSATSVRTLLNPCAQGTSSLTRAGRRTTMTSLEYRFFANVAATTTGASPIRLCIVYDKQPNGAAPAATDVFIGDVIYGLMNLNNSRRFKVLVDEIIEELSVNGTSSFYRKGYRDFTAKGTKKGLECEFKDASAGDITDITTGSIYAFVWQSGGLLVASPTNVLETRIRFVDP